jgi:hypothetical protein
VSDPAPELSLEVPSEFVELADGLDAVADTLYWYLGQDDLWQPASPAALLIDDEPAFTALPFERPITSTLVQPLIMLDQAADHLVACAAIIRTPRTALSLLTTLRPLAVACGWAYYLTNPDTDAREHVRRALNVQLESDTELMNYIQLPGPELDKVDKRRRDIAGAARTLGFRVIKPDKRANATTWPTWYVGDRPPSEMKVLNDLLGSTQTRQIGHDLYRLLSAATHAQQHAIYAVMQVSQATPAADGLARVPFGITGRSLVSWTAATTAALDRVIQQCCSYYGWPPLRWNSIAAPKVIDWLQTARQA